LNGRTQAMVGFYDAELGVSEQQLTTPDLSKVEVGDATETLK
jgi:hypothetical protein